MNLVRVLSWVAASVIVLTTRVALAAPLSFESAKTTDASPRIAIVGATLHDGDGNVTPDAVVEFEGARIVRVATGAASGGATVVDGHGHRITPGLIAAATPLGLVEISMESSTRDTTRHSETDVVHAGHDAALAINANSSLLAVQAIEGITSAASTPQGGLLSGQVAWIDLLTGHHRDIVARSQIAVAGSLGQTVAESRSATLAKLAQVLDDAAFYRARRPAYDRRQLRNLSAHPLDLDALGPVLGRQVPLVLEVHRASDLLALASLATKNKLRVVVVGASQAWQVADVLAESGISVLVQPSSNLPSGFDRLGSRLDAAALLHQAGVEIGIGMLGAAHNARNVTQEAGIAIANGLPPEVALSAVTRNIARAYGMQSDYGTVAVGKVANLVLWPDDPFELSTVPAAVYIRGQALPMTSRQTQLRDRYLDLSPYR